MIHFRPFSPTCTRAAAAALGLIAVMPTAADAAPTQQYTASTELVRVLPDGSWLTRTKTEGSFGTDDGSPLSPLRRMKLDFPRGSRLNGEFFPVCTRAKLEASACPARSMIGSGTVFVPMGTSPLEAEMRVFNGPAQGGVRTMWFDTRALGSIRMMLEAKMTRATGKYAMSMTMDIPPIVPKFLEGGMPMSGFTTTLTGLARNRGRLIPLISAPSSCSGAGWPFSATFTYADTQVRTVDTVMPCTLKSVPVS